MLAISHRKYRRGFCSDRVSQTTVLKVETNIWAPMSTPALTRTKELEALQADVDTLSGPGEIVITTPEVGPAYSTGKNKVDEGRFS